jgi:hypothetical protein
LAARVRDALLRDVEPDALLLRDDGPEPLRADELRAEDEPDPLREDLLRDDDEPEPEPVFRADDPPLDRDDPEPPLLRAEELRDDDERDEPPDRDDPPLLPPLPLPELRFDSAMSRSSSAPKYGRDHVTLNRASTGA